MAFWTKKTPEQLAERREEKRLKQEELVKEKAYRVRKLNIDGNNPDVNYHEITLNISELRQIIIDMQKTGVYSGNYGELPEDQCNPTRYRVYEVQRLLDYAKGCRYAMNWLMKNSVEHGVAYYNDEGKFKFKDIDEDESKIG